MTDVTRAPPMSGSPVAVKPLMTQACRPRQTNSPTGRPVARIARAAASVASSIVG
jgi:hypothetical protein